MNLQLMSPSIFEYVDIQSFTRWIFSKTEELWNRC